MGGSSFLHFWDIVTGGSAVGAEELCPHILAQIAWIFFFNCSVSERVWVRPYLEAEIG